MTKNQVAELYQLLTAENRGKATKLNKLAAINGICEKLAKKGIAIEITNLVDLLMQQGICMSPRSIYNKEGGRNPYRRLVDAWSENATYERANKQSEKKEITAQEELVTENDLSKITDPVLRYKISLLYGEVTGLRNQNDMLRNVNELPAIQTVASTEFEQLEAKDIMLDDYEIDVLESFVNSDSSIAFDENGRLYAKTAISRQTSLSSDDLKNALEKVLRSYGRN
ncbi:MAG: gamma-mobile-trio protein GmtX [Pseudomonadota bacterium]|nr:gamma-mobile-trio protein GmtX [Pseudomonadota bacterium]